MTTSCLRRVHTLMLPVVTDIGELYRTADGGAMASLIAKLAIEKSYQSKLDETRSAVQVRQLSMSGEANCYEVPY